MGAASYKRKRSLAARAQIDRLISQQRHVLFIHYSCESFYNRDDGLSPRITSIAVKRFDNGQTLSFSIHQIGETRGITGEIPIDKYDDLELEMLNEFSAFIRSHTGYNWVHWNMRDSTYGFAAIVHRHRVLGGSPASITDEDRIDLSALLIDIYGPNYATHPRLTVLINLNGISPQAFLSGADEAIAFENGQYVTLHQSTLRKVDLLPNILQRVADGTLKTNSTWRDIYGTSIGGMVEVITSSWQFKLISAVAIIISLIRIAVWLYTLVKDSSVP